MHIFSFQAKEAGADDVLDISKCELSEVCSLQLLILAGRSDFSVYSLLPCITSTSFETEMTLGLLHFLLCVLSSVFQAWASSSFSSCPIWCFHTNSVLGILFHLTKWEGQSSLRRSLVWQIMVVTRNFFCKKLTISKLELQSLPLALIFSVSANPWFQVAG